MSDSFQSRTSPHKEGQNVRDGMSFSFVLGRAQKISTAVYLVTGLWDEREPLRQELRKKVLKVMSDIRNVSDNPVQNEQIVSQVKAELEHVLSMTDVAVRSRLMSEMNNGFLRAEIEAFMQEVVAAVRKSSDGGTIAGSIKDIAAPRVAVKALLPKKQPPISKGHDKGQDIGRIRHENQPVFGTFQTMTGPIKDIISSSSTGDTRKDKIYAIIKEKGELTIKDIAQVAPEYSEKTIQRDLVDMVSSGRLQKKGERRWTVYYV